MRRPHGIADRLRRSVLEGLGWKMHRIWSTDWWRNRKVAEERLLATVEEAAKDFASKKETETESPPSENYPTDTDRSLFVEEEKTIGKEEPLRFAEAMPVPVTVPEEKGRERAYPEIVVIRQAAPETFYEPSALPMIQKQMRRIIEHEGPLLESLLFRRVLAEWGFARSGSRIRTILENGLPITLAKTEQNGEPVYWPLETAPEDFEIYRVPTEQTESQRKAEELPIEEIANAMLEILERYLSYPREDLLRETGRQFGIGRLTDAISGYLNAGLERLIGKEQVNADEQTIRLRE